MFSRQAYIRQDQRLYDVPNPAPPFQCKPLHLGVVSAVELNAVPGGSTPQKVAFNMASFLIEQSSRLVKPVVEPN